MNDLYFYINMNFYDVCNKNILKIIDFKLLNQALNIKFKIEKKSRFL